MSTSHPAFDHIDMLDASVRNASFMEAGHMVRNAQAHIKNALGMTQDAPSLRRAGQETLDQVQQFATTLTITYPKEQTERARRITREQIATFRDLIGQAPKSAMAIALGL